MLVKQGIALRQAQDEAGISREYQGVAGAGPSPRLRIDREIQGVEDSSEKQPRWAYFHQYFSIVSPEFS